MGAALWVLVVLQQTPLVTESKCGAFSVVVTSPSGEPVNDDGRVEVVTAKGRVAVPFKPAWFTGLGAHPAPGLLCGDALVAWTARPNIVVLLLSRSGRPGLDLASFAVVDLERHAVLDVFESRLEIASGRHEEKGFRFVTRAASDGFDVRLVREWLPGDDTPTGAIEDWFAVRVKARKLSTGWLRP